MVLDQMITAPPVDPADREKWLAWRRRGIGASDMGAVLGLSPYRTPLDVYLDKVGEGVPQEENEAMRIGKAAEPMLASLYRQATGRALIAEQVPVVGPAPYLIATLDGIAEDDALVELKTTAGRRTDELGEEGTDELPRDWLVQAHHQMLCADADRCDFGVLTGGFGFRFRVYTVRREPQWDLLLKEAAASFWDRVVTRNPPELTLPEDRENLARLFRPSGSTVTLSNADACTALSWEMVKAQMKALGEEKDRLESILRLAMGEATFGTLPDGRMLRRYRQEMPERTQTVKPHVRDYLQITKGAR